MKWTSRFAAEVAKLKVEMEAEAGRLFHLNNPGKPAQSARANAFTPEEKRNV